MLIPFGASERRLASFLIPEGGKVSYSFLSLEIKPAAAQMFVQSKPVSVYIFFILKFVSCFFPPLL